MVVVDSPIICNSGDGCLDGGGGVWQEEARRLYDKMKGWDVKRIVPAHTSLVTEGGKEALLDGFSFLA